MPRCSDFKRLAKFSRQLVPDFRRRKGLKGFVERLQGGGIQVDVMQLTSPVQQGRSFFVSREHFAGRDDFVDFHFDRWKCFPRGHGDHRQRHEE